MHTFIYLYLYIDIYLYLFEYIHRNKYIYLSAEYLWLIGHVDKSSLYETLFHCNILSKHHHHIQMFPEMDGYTAAIPSKRDMQALVKVYMLKQHVLTN
jgi:hypothetical protein